MWRPSASIDTLRARARLLARVRQFFAERDVLEVDTPAMSAATVTDVHLHTFQTRFVGPGAADGQTLYLQTSPEFHMKRLLAAGSGAIFQICKSFRNEESGRYHNPEFTMLEWYRPGFDHFALMAEMDELLQQILSCGQATRISYQQAFIDHLDIDPLTATLAELREAVLSRDLGDFAAEEENSDTLLQLLFALVIEPKIGREAPCFVYHFPASQAALAQIHEADPRVAERFEVYYRGIELANGFHELSDGNEQRRRFEQDNRERIGMGLAPQPIDEHLIAALNDDFPDCAGVALGLDRLMMLALDCDAIDQVMAFPLPRA